jgi:hypothetical protein
MPITDPPIVEERTRNAEGRPTHLPSMPDRLQKVAMVMAVVSFLSVAIMGNVAAAVMSAASLIGIVYLGFLFTYGVRKVIRRESEPPHRTSVRG